jgi:excisionase family DNA binding protein
VPGDEDPEYLTVTEVARILRFSIRTIERWTDEGRLPFVLMSGEKRFARDDVDAMLRRLTDCE